MLVNVALSAIALLSARALAGAPLLNPPLPTSTQERRAPAPAEPAERCLTNADCMRAGQPLLKPKSRSRSHLLVPRQSGVPTTTYTGTIRVVDTESTSTLGYISATANQLGEYGLLVSDTADALVVSYEATSSDASQVDFTIETAQQLSGYPYLCSVAGFGNTDPLDELNTGSYNLRIDFSVLTPSLDAPGPAQAGDNSYNYAVQNSTINRDVETAVWSISSAGEITNMWINPATATTPVPVTYFLNGNGPDSSDLKAIAITADVDAFQTHFAKTYSTIVWRAERTVTETETRRTLL
ncbi:hypothetical protein JCM24511_04564 [Saitozyma sp. JCM 24511]|nr:hypothetical protein JCM24511_04564 [Saitozyma sp. JCM 24511]